MPEELKIKRSTLAVALILIVVLGIIVWQVYYAAPPTPAKYKYTTGLTVKFKIYNPAIYALETSNVQVEFYTSGTDPFQRTFTTKPVATASYGGTNAPYWSVPLDAGSYVVLIRDTAGSKSFYPEMYSVTVPGTNSEDKEVWLTPSQLSVYDRATITLAKAILAYNATSGAYDISVSTINITRYTKWQVTYTITASDANSSKIVKAGRMLLTDITNLIPVSASMDGVSASVTKDSDASDDGISGVYYIETSAMEVGEVHRIDVYFEESGTASTGILTAKLYEYYACLRSGTILRWWTDKTIPITVQA
jgi:hypothetical protein